MSIKVKLYFCVVFAFLFYSCASIKNETFLVGTYSENSNQGINVIDFNAKNNSLTLKKVITGVENPSFVITNKAKTIVVTVEEIASIDGGKVTSFTYNSKYGTFKKVNSCFTKGNHPCTIAFSKDEKHILVGNYSGGNLGVFPIDKLGNLSEIKELIQHEGKSINTNRQEKPHVHSIVLHPSENKIFVTDLGTDEIEIIPIDEDPKTILQKQHAMMTCKVPAGSGPRHLVFNKKGTKAYVTFELTNQIGVFNYLNNVLTFEKTINLTTDETKNGSAAEL
ncbi:MAG: beta-propeller fold lactonase family protein, partial [Flavobacterium sp.]|nr:beta-propeller fold lactonase family protein [Flavobacterium sp.]